MNQITKAQIKLYKKAKFKNGQYHLKEKHILKLIDAISEYVDDKLSFNDDEERIDIIQKLLTGSLEEVTQGLNDIKD